MLRRRIPGEAGTMRATAWLIVALCAVGALADEPKKKKNEKKPKKQQKQKDCPACPADLSDELAAATKRAEGAQCDYEPCRGAHGARFAAYPTAQQAWQL